MEKVDLNGVISIREEGLLTLTTDQRRLDDIEIDLVEIVGRRGAGSDASLPPPQAASTPAIASRASVVRIRQ
jgi:hypothetical protein